MSDCTPQPESRPMRDPDPPGVVSGVTCCAHHAMTAHGLRHAHGSDEGHARRVAQIAASCPDCLRHQEDA